MGFIAPINQASGDRCIQGFDIVCIRCTMFIRVWWQYIWVYSCVHKVARFQQSPCRCMKKAEVFDEHVHNGF
ncbi:hypothetical protein DPMN_089080 [Dreissena polymorpha]|uniref:Uncharacterized protein n=1 Tax=Dreissena polymorpha TaxID=45954 RepID=A0A9D4I7D4_DREPO|nr:hypothetical protein DPMN_183879 [Dreissena polymorpha]KAH3846774.1 hypothetical protein DPMN_089080 [Dreissena polymorpha]